MFEPKNEAFTQTINDPTHIITNIDVTIVYVDYPALKDKVVANNIHNPRGPHKSPLLMVYYNF